MTRLDELADVILPAVAASGQLGDDVILQTVDLDPESKGQAQFASTVCFVVAEFKSTSRGLLKQPLVVKYNITDKAARDWLKLDYQFCNEVVVYEKVLPFLELNNIVSNTFPKFFYGSASLNQDPNNYIIVLEDLRKSEFVLSPEILNLDFAHCALAFKKLGAFHALSFAAKKSRPVEFFKIVRSLVETKQYEDNRVDGDYLYGRSVGRAAAPLIETGLYIEQINQFRDKLKDSLAYFEKLFAVEEPMGVVCHGDFCRNNVLYRYKNDKPVDIRFFDLATARYGSPMLDFTFFFFLNCSEESRRNHREEFLRIYHESLTTTVPGVEVPTLEQFRREFFEKAVYGFLHCSFFKPAMMDPEPFQPSVEVRKPIEERTAKVVANGGQEATGVIANMLRELIESGCSL